MSGAMDERTTTGAGAPGAGAGREGAARRGRRAALIVVPSALVVGGVVALAVTLGGGGDDELRSEPVPSATTTSTIEPSGGDDFSETVATSDTLPGRPATTARPGASRSSTTVRATTTVATTTTTLAPTTTATTVPPTTAPPAPAPQPIAPPADPRGYEESVRLGSMSIPKLGLEAPLYEGIRLTTLDRGPGHWPGTAMPGDVGNAVIAAHRTSHEAHFRHIDQLVPGDQVRFEVGGRSVSYSVTSTEIVQPDALWIVDQTPTATATLFACHPPGSVSQRIVVHLALDA